MAGEGGVVSRIFRRAARPQLPREAPPPPVPATVLVRPEVLTVITSASEDAGTFETGGPLIGTVQRSWEPAGERLIVSVLATVSPGPGTRGKASSVALGRPSEGERAASAVRSWRTVTGMDLVHLGDWHKHPSRCPDPSRGDVATARRMLAESAVPVWLVAIAVGEDRREEDRDVKGNAVRLTTRLESSQEIRFYREAGRADLAGVPIRVERMAVPRLPSLAWNVADPIRFAAECRLLDAAGFKTAIGSGNRSNGVTLRVSRNGRALTVSISDPYPEKAPNLGDENGRRIDPRDWSPDRFLVDLVREVW
jgi:proteasome lid subunit RPN8/RPN11